MNRVLLRLFPVLLAGWAAGCAGYRLGPTNGLPAREKSVQVAVFQNATSEPRLGEAVVHALRKRFQQEGTFRLATQGDGDIIVSGVIIDFARSAVSYQPGDIIAVRDYDITMRARVRAEERSGGRTLLDQEVTGHATVRIGADQASAERQVLPVLAGDLAFNIAAKLVDGTW
jgi:hypothetical protein